MGRRVFFLALVIIARFVPLRRPQPFGLQNYADRHIVSFLRKYSFQISLCVVAAAIIASGVSCFVTLGRLPLSSEADPGTLRAEAERIRRQAMMTVVGCHTLLMAALALYFAQRRSRRSQRELRLKQQEAMLAEILDPIHITDQSGRIVYWNRGAETLFGFQHAEAIGNSSHDLLHTTPVDGAWSADRTDPDRWKGEVTARTKTDEGIRLERRRTRVRDGEHVVGEVIIDLDIGERGQLEKASRRRQRLESLGTLSSGIAHDLNNLLTPILMSAGLLNRDSPNLDREALVETIVRSAKRGRELILKLLTFARGGEAPHQPVAIDAVLEEAVQIIRHTMPREIAVTHSISPDLPKTFGDPTEIVQVLVNLAINARDAMPEGGTLHLSAGELSLRRERSFAFTTLQPGRYIEIIVKDSGAGIPANIREAIFDPFYSTKERGQGTGLGLSTSLGIIRGHRGAINLKSEVGVGTEVTVVLPVHESTEDREESEST